MITLADRALQRAKKAQLEETARLLALNLAHYKIRFREIELENFDQLMETQAIDEARTQLLAVAMEDLIGVLGLVGKQDEAVGGPTH